MRRIISYTQAINEAQEIAMKKNNKVIAIGEGVPDPKAIFGTTSGLFDKFGNNRVFDSPLSENGVTGICIGLALNGLRPILIHQRIDFSLLSMDQIVNNAAKWHYMFNGQSNVPLVIRLIIGRGWGQGPQHSQGLHGMFSQIPGLKVVMPSTAYDAKGMLLSSIKDNNPVLFIEHRWLHNMRDFVPKKSYYLPLDKAKKINTGKDVTIVSFSLMSIDLLRISKIFKKSFKVGVDLIDMRSLRPLDMQAITKSLKKTGRLIVADNSFNSASISSEIISQCVEKLLPYLKQKPLRISYPEFPIPTSHYMTKEFYPDHVDIFLKIANFLKIDKKSDIFTKIIDSIKNNNYHDIPNKDFTGPF